ncbi:hypothetical protein Tco_1262174 [Tanacetum coccineum]
MSSATQKYYSSSAPQQLDSGLVVPSFNPFDDLIANLNKLMTFVSTSFGPRFPQTNNQLRTSSNPRNQATIQEGRVTVQIVQGRQTQGYVNTRVRNNATNQGGAYLDPEQLAFLADNGDKVIPAQASQAILTPTAFQTDDLDAFDSICDDVTSTKAALMANLSSYDSDVLSEVLFHDTNIENDMIYQSVQETQCSEQSFIDNDTEIDITSDSNIISYKQYLQENENPVVQNINSSAQQDEVLIVVIKEMSSQVAKYNKVQQENLIVYETLSAELERYKEQEVLALYDGHTIVKTHVALSVTYTEETLDLAEDNKKYFEIEKKELSLDNDRLLEHIICQDVMNTVMHANDHSDNVLHAKNNSLEHDNSVLELLKHENDRLMELLISQDLVHTVEFFIINELQAQLEAKNVSIAKLKEHITNLKGKNTIESVQNVHNSNVVTSKVYTLDLQPLPPLVKHNRDAHVNYLKHTKENADTLREIIEQARELRPLDSDLHSACKFVTHIQELLVYVNDTCPSSKHVSNKLVVITPINRAKKVRFAESNDTSKDKTQNQLQLQEKQTTNNLVSSSTGVTRSTEASGSKPMSNTKKDMTTQTSSSNKKKTKVEDQPKIANYSLNNVNHVSKTVCIEMLSTIDYLNDVNAHVKSKSVKSRSAKSKKKKMWKPTGKVYTNVGYSWKPIEWIFTIDGNTCPLTRIISTKVVPPRKSNSTTIVKQTQQSSNKSGKLKEIKNVGSSSKSKTIGSKISNHSEPMKT